MRTCELKVPWQMVITRLVVKQDSWLQENLFSSRLYTTYRLQPSIDVFCVYKQNTDINIDFERACKYF